MSAPIDPIDAVGSVEHEGVLIFAAGGHSLPLKSRCVSPYEMLRRERARFVLGPT